MNPLHKIAMMLLKGAAKEISRQEREKARFEELRREQTLRTLQPETVILKGDGAMPEIPAAEPPKDSESKKSNCTRRNPLNRQKLPSAKKLNFTRKNSVSR